jgi:16S rRNA (cytosine1402-N4)-methyltransferase
MNFAHEPVMLAEVLQILDPKPGQVFVDCTVGGGGHSFPMIERLMPGGRLIAIDRDAAALAAAKDHLARFQTHVAFIRDNYSNLKDILSGLGLGGVDGILLDAGVSSYQLDEADRGFSYRAEAALDMRMDRESPVTAEQLVNNLETGELARIIRLYGEELWARRIARFITDRREKRGPIRTTGELVEVIKAAIPARARRRGVHPARRTFQALRIVVNDELGALEQAVRDGIDLLNPKGRFAVITFHSLEDRLVKNIFREVSAGCQCPPGLPRCACGRLPVARVLTARPLVAGPGELADNPRARSAKLRAAEKVLNRGEGE